jgi:hypothetical protein
MRLLSLQRRLVRGREGGALASSRSASPGVRTGGHKEHSGIFYGACLQVHVSFSWSPCRSPARPRLRFLSSRCRCVPRSAPALLLLSRAMLRCPPIPALRHGCAFTRIPALRPVSLRLCATVVLSRCGCPDHRSPASHEHQHAIASPFPALCPCPCWCWRFKRNACRLQRLPASLCLSFGVVHVLHGFPAAPHRHPLTTMRTSQTGWLKKISG